MNEFEKIRITHGPSIELMVDNPTELKLVDKGAHGAVFRLPGDRCVKIYADVEIALMEAQAYKRSQGSDIIPKLYESGNNYNIMEYVDGKSLLFLLSQNKELTPDISSQLIKLFREMQHIGFTRIDSSLRHVIVDRNGAYKVIDLVYSYHVSQAYP
ncbi:MAG TPA: serine/threonine protein kinase, partial [Negativicutes bacterium]|nr:serine/threonine protein kinase [Negativicutes bacterium]